LEPRTAFYDWLYLNALHRQAELRADVMEYQAFTDIAFNPERSINCQAYSASLYVALAKRGVIDQVLESKETYLQAISALSPMPLTTVEVSQNQLPLPPMRGSPPSSHSSSEGKNMDMNRAYAHIQKRAETADLPILVKTFVDQGNLLNNLSSRNHQVIFGRRGTGKTHALKYLEEHARSNRGLAVYIDLRQVGSTGGLYSDTSRSIAERATRLLSDVGKRIHEELLSIAVTAKEGDFHLGVVGPILDQLLDEASRIRVEGEVTEETAEKSVLLEKLASSLSLSVEELAAKLGLSAAASVDSTSEKSRTSVSKGRSVANISFGAMGTIFRQLAQAIGNKNIWILFDEWSDVPLELQPYLADLIRRTLLSAERVIVKIAAIEQRCRFKQLRPAGDYVGIELGADVSADLDLDDFMVFENDSARAVQFFSELLHRHVQQACQDLGIDAPGTRADFVRLAFTQRSVLEELVRAAEGVPRDAINVLVLSGQEAGTMAISMPDVRKAAHIWYQRDKERVVSANADARSLLEWIIDEVIAHRRARAFLLRRGDANRLIDDLFDARVLHFLKKNIAAHDQPGIKYDCYKIDYGCYVDLFKTGRDPQGTIPSGDGSGSYIDVPPDDYRSIRRAILDLADFEKQRASVLL
jgi:hypothetical protein